MAKPRPLASFSITIASFRTSCKSLVLVRLFQVLCFFSSLFHCDDSSVIKHWRWRQVQNYFCLNIIIYIRKSSITFAWVWNTTVFWSSLMSLACNLFVPFCHTKYCFVSSNRGIFFLGTKLGFFLENIRLDSGPSATKYYCHFFIYSCHGSIVWKLNPSFCHM